MKDTTRDLSVSEMRAASGGTSIYSMYALPPGAPVTDTMAAQGFFDPVNTGNAFVDMVNTFALVATGELSAAALEQYEGQQEFEVVRWGTGEIDIEFLGMHVLTIDMQEFAEWYKAEILGGGDAYPYDHYTDDPHWWENRGTHGSGLGGPY
ncbi:MAG: hypothetical protein RIA71_08485 [Oceanicaulis sp.]